jgi:hypothetical protein
LNQNHLSVLIAIWLITTFILRLLFVSDIQALLRSKREINIDSFEDLIENNNIVPMVESNSSANRIVAQVNKDLFLMTIHLNYYFILL